MSRRRIGTLTLLAALAHGCRAEPPAPPTPVPTPPAPTGEPVIKIRGLKKIYDRYKNGEDLSPLLTGKVSLEYLDAINSLTQKGFAVPARFITDAYASNSNRDETVDFILNNLK